MTDKHAEIARQLRADVQDKDFQIHCLRIALAESVKLQSHYAGLLNMHDGGRRLQFDSADGWIQRLTQTGTIQCE